MEPSKQRAVRAHFIRLYKKGHLYRADRIVHWCLTCQTTYSDLEALHVVRTDQLSYVRYPWAQPMPAGTPDLVVATTRPETIVADTAIAVHPDDPRWKSLIGKEVLVPIVDRKVKVIGDEAVDREFGTGALKVTPGHDATDFEIGQLHGLQVLSAIDTRGLMTSAAGPLAGLDRDAARAAAIARLNEKGLLVRQEPITHSVGIHDRCETIDEPLVMKQWWMRMKPLAKPAIEAVRSGKTRIIPKWQEKVYFEWMENIRDWSVSRQIWWGHSIPVWYCRDCDEIVVPDEDAPDPTECPKCRSHDLRQDPDVLDTWFSSALWPHTTLGWPEHTKDLARFYPGSMLETGWDILFFWVARMVLTSLFNLNEVPFHHVYIHPKMLDTFGEGMSKSKGNGVDPLDIVDRYGTDALRFGIIHLATETQDSRMPVSNVCPHCDRLVPAKQEHMYMRTRKVTCPNCKKPFRPGGPWPAPDPELPTAKQASESFELGRNFANKLWNAARFLLLNLEGYTPGAIRLEELPIEDRWILSRLTTTSAAVTEDLEGYHFSEAARSLYDFTWSEFCDRYVEMSKGRLRDAGSRPLAQRVLVGVLDAILRLVHPIMPFVAESIWQALADAAFERGLPAPDPAAESVVIAPWPELPVSWKDVGMEHRMARMQELVRLVREVRNRYNVDARTSLDVFVRCNDGVAADFRVLLPFITTLAGVGRLECGQGVAKPPQAASHVHPEFEAYVSLHGLIDVVEEGKRLEKQLLEK